MTSTTKRLLSEALDLPQVERVELTSKLLESLDEDTDTEIEAAWIAEIERRCAALDAGEAVSSDWSEVRQRIENEIFGR